MDGLTPSAAGAGPRQGSAVRALQSASTEESTTPDDKAAPPPGATGASHPEHSASRGGTNTAVARWRGGWRCDVDAGGFAVVVDEPPAAGGEGLGPMPTDLFLASLSSCYALALAWAARKRGFELPDLEVRATGTYQGQRFSTLELLVTTSLPDDALAPLIEPARRVCYVSNTVACAAPITVTRAAAPR